MNYPPNQHSPNNPTTPGQYYQTPPPLPKRGFFHHKVPVWFFLITLVFVITIASTAIIAFQLGRSSASNGAVNTAQQANTVPQANTTPQVNTASSTATQINTASNGSTSHKFQGHGNLKTDPITITSSTWKMNWTCDPSSFDGIQWNFMVSLDNTDGTVREYYTINEICSPGITSGSKTEYQGGTFYLEIIAEGSWSLTIQEIS